VQLRTHFRDRHLLFLDWSASQTNHHRANENMPEPTTVSWYTFYQFQMRLESASQLLPQRQRRVVNPYLNDVGGREGVGI
jgi:hypothetical protein